MAVSQGGMRMDAKPIKTAAEKLGIREGARIVALGAPPDYVGILGLLPESVWVTRRLDQPAGFIHCFATDRRELESDFPILKGMLQKDGTLWISWPKRASKVQTDLTDGAVREIGLANGLVDVKVCSVNEVWSGLKFVYRLKDRG